MATNNEDVLKTTIADLKARLDAARPASCRALKNLDRWYDVELTYTSNAIEGNTLTRSETALVIEKGITIGGKPLAAHNEALDHFAALRVMREIAAQRRPALEADVLRLHGILMYRSKPEHGSRYADFPRRITGSPVILPGPRKIPGLMEEFGRVLAGASGWGDAFEAHYGLVSIHPFADGNGRTARLLMNLILLRDGYPPVSIGPSERSEYIDLLERRQLAEPLGHDLIDAMARRAYTCFMARRLVSSLEDHLSFLETDREGPDDDGRSPERAVDVRS